LTKPLIPLKFAVDFKNDKTKEQLSMAHHKSAKKRIQIAERNTLRNRMYKSRMKTAMRRVLEAENKDVALSALNGACSVIDKLAQKGIIPKNRAAHKKSRLMRFVQKMN
jgi:small subunit ribosomal protein S20